MRLPANLFLISSLLHIIVFLSVTSAVCVYQCLFIRQNYCKWRDECNKHFRFHFVFIFSVSFSAAASALESGDKLAKRSAPQHRTFMVYKVGGWHWKVISYSVLFTTGVWLTSSTYLHVAKSKHSLQQNEGADRLNLHIPCNTPR